MTDRELLQQALEALEYGIDYVKSEETTNKQIYKGYEHLCPDDSYYVKFIDDAIETLRTRLAQPEPEPEPVAKVVLTETIGLPCLQWLDLTRQFDFKGGEFLYTAPPNREWVGLTDEEIEDLWGEPVNCMYSGHYNAIRAIEAKIKENNI